MVLKRQKTKTVVTCAIVISAVVIVFASIWLLFNDTYKFRGTWTEQRYLESYVRSYSVKWQFDGFGGLTHIYNDGHVRIGSYSVNGSYITVSHNSPLPTWTTYLYHFEDNTLVLEDQGRYSQKTYRLTRGSDEGL